MAEHLRLRSWYQEDTMTTSNTNPVAQIPPTQGHSSPLLPYLEFFFKMSHPHPLQPWLQVLPCFPFSV